MNRSTPHRLSRWLLIGAASAMAATSVTACGSSSTSTASTATDSTTTEATEPTADPAAADTSADSGADTGTDTGGGEESAAAPALPAVSVTKVSDGATVELSSLATAQPTLVWFWAPT